MPSPRLPDRSNPLPLWAQVLDDLRRRVALGDFADGFPTDKDLVDQYEVSRHTARDAARRLQQEGVIERERGRGSFVRLPDLEQPVGQLYSLYQSIQRQGYEQRSTVLDVGERTDPTVAGSLGLAADAPLVYIRRLRMADETPVAVDELWLPAAIGRPLLTADLTHGAVYDELERLGTSPTSGSERLHADLPDPETRRLLGVGSRQAVFVIERQTEHLGTPLETRRTVIRGDLYTVVSSWSGPSSAAQFEPRADSR